MEGYLLAIDEQKIITKATAKRRERDPTIRRQMDSKCRLCRKGEETLNHILASCEKCLQVCTLHTDITEWEKLYMMKF